MKVFRAIGVLCALTFFGMMVLNGQTLSRQEAEEDLAEFARILEYEAAYLGRTDLDLKAEVARLNQKISGRESWEVQEFRWELEKIITQLGDRHARVFEPSGTPRLARLPFAVAPHQGKVLALRETTEDHFFYLSANFPYLKSIEGIPVEDLLPVENLRHAAAPGEAAHFRAVGSLRKIGKIFQRMGKPLPDPMTFTLSNGTQDSLCKLPLAKSGPKWTYAGHMPTEYGRKMEKQDYEPLFQWKSEKVAYLAIPRMVSEQNHPRYFSLLKQKMKEFSKAQSLIIDLRGNLGGRRDLVNELLPRFIKPSGPPEILNVAYIRSDQDFYEDIESMQGRFLYSDHSPFFGPVEEIAIRNHMKKFSPEWKVPERRYSQPYFFAVRGHSRKPERYFSGQVYVMVDELTYSAAGFFGAVCKDLNGIILVGKTPDPCSGRVREFPLPHSIMEVQVSRMASFHPDGSIFDGTAFPPDLMLDRDIEQIFGNRDTQLEKLLEFIEGNKN